MVEFVATIVINTTPAEVFRFVADVEKYPQWIHGARTVNLSEGPFGDGTLFQQDHEVVRVSHVHVNHGFETESIRIHFPTRLFLKHTHGLVQVEPVEQGAQLTLTHHVELTPLLKPFAHLLAKKAQQDSQSALAQFKQLLEHQTAEASIQREL